MKYRQRQQRLRKWLQKKNLDGILITDLTNVRYLCGFTGSSGAVLLTRTQGVFLTDCRYQTQSKQEVKGLRVSVQTGKTLSRQLAPFFSSSKDFCLAIESENLTVLQHARLTSQLPEKVSIEPVHDAVQHLRLRKESREIQMIRQAARITLHAFEQILQRIKPGVTEKDIQRQIRSLFEDLGADGEAFPTIVLFGRRTALVHGQPSEVRLKKNDLVLFDFGAKFHGYCADFTRTFCLGKPSDSVRRVFQAVKKALQLAEAEIRPGQTGREVDKIVRQFLGKKDMDKRFPHALGHGVGLEIHEDPRLATSAKSTLKTNMVVTVEPGVYDNRWGGVRLENLVLVKRQGCENLTPAPLQLVL